MQVYNLLIGGEAGQGIETTVAVLQKFFKRTGYKVFTVRDYMSRVRGGHNFSLIRFGVETIQSHSNQLDGIIALNEETVKIHKGSLKKDGFILCDSGLGIKEDKVIKIDMVSIAQDIGNSRVAGNVAVGSVLKLFDLKLDNVKEVLSEYVKPQYVDINIDAISRGYDLVDNRFTYLENQGDSKDEILLSGNEALSLGAMAAGLGFYSAYPMSPATSIMEFLASKSQELGIVVEQAEDEIAAINMAIGASFAGVPSMTGTSGGGFSLKVEALGLSGIAEIPLVVVNVQRPGPATGLPTRTEQSDLKFVISASHGEFPRMVIALRNHEDAFYQTARALYLAEKYQIPIIVLSDQYLADASAIVKRFDVEKAHKAMEHKYEDVAEGEYLRYKLTEDGISPRLFPGKTKNFVTADSDEHDEMGRITESAEVRNSMVEKRLKKLDLLKEELLSQNL